MENTGKVFFENDTSQWFVAMGERWLGPLTAAQVYKQIESGQLTWAHFVWKSGQATWQRICDVKTFQAVVPHLPAKAITTEVKKEAAKPEVRQSTKRYPSPPPVPQAKDDEEKKWFLYYNQSQFGPFSKSEVLSALGSGKINEKILVWQDGMEEWQRLDQVEAFRTFKAGKAGRAVAPLKKADNRQLPRRPLVAKVVMAHDDSVSVGVCRDVSVGGMQVLTDRIPGAAGKRIKLNVSAMGQIAPFVAEGVIVRLLEDGRGFSFRFEKMTEQAKKAIQKYIDASGV